MNDFVVNLQKWPLRKIVKALALAFLFMMPLRVFAAEMVTASASPLAGIKFDDRPMLLPVQRNFQMAMLKASSELGRSCGDIESYGWLLKEGEQQRVNQIFNNTVDRIRALGYIVSSEQTDTVSRDVTFFTADNPEKHLLFLWSAGDVGLVLVLCETSAPLNPIAYNDLRKAESLRPNSYPLPREISQGSASSLRVAAGDGRQPRQLTQTESPENDNFTPLGTWKGSYICSQGETGATLDIKSIQEDSFEGEFSFYPLSKNPNVATGKYKVSGEYDQESQRILLNPGEWINRPKGYYNTIMIGSFDPMKETFSAFFEGITGCTSFEARHELRYEFSSEKGASKPKAKKKSKVRSAKKKEAKSVKAKKAKVEKESVKKENEPQSPPVIEPRTSSFEMPQGGISLE